MEAKINKTIITAALKAPSEKDIQYLSNSHDELIKSIAKFNFKSRNDIFQFDKHVSIYICHLQCNASDTTVVVFT